MTISQLLIAFLTFVSIFVIFRLIIWGFKTAVRQAIQATQERVVSLEKHERLIWDVAMQRAFETLHHADQPAFDLLLEEFRAHTMTEQQLTQFIERLEVLIQDEHHPERMPAANLLLESALIEREARHGFHGFTRTEVQRGENILAGEVMAKEAKDRQS